MKLFEKLTAWFDQHDVATQTVMAATGGLVAILTFCVLLWFYTMTIWLIIMGAAMAFIFLVMFVTLAKSLEQTFKARKRRLREIHVKREEEKSNEAF